jgi:hypothetical protein
MSVREFLEGNRNFVSEAVTIPDSGFTPFSDYIITGDGDRLKDWLETGSGQSYLKKLISEMPEGYLELNRGLTDEVNNIDDIQFEVSSLVSFTESEDVAKEFARNKGSEQIVKVTIPARSVIFHFDYIDDDSLGPIPVELEQEVIAQWGTSSRITDLVEV